MDTAVALLMICVLGFLAHFLPRSSARRPTRPTRNMFRARNGITCHFPVAEIFQGLARIVGIVIVPSLTALLVVALPFIDRRLERRPWKRPLAVGIYLRFWHADRLWPAQ